MNTLSRSRDHDERTLRNELKGHDHVKWEAALQQEEQTLKIMKLCDNVKRAKDAPDFKNRIKAKTKFDRADIEA